MSRGIRKTGIFIAVMLTVVVLTGCQIAKKDESGQAKEELYGAYAVVGDRIPDGKIAGVKDKKGFVHFKKIKGYLPMSEIYKLYPTLHEASEEKFVDVANSILKRKNIATKLQTVRKAVGLSQKELSEKSGVTLRMIQQYEQRAKDINKASAGNLFALARVLGCKAEDLLE